MTRLVTKPAKHEAGVRAKGVDDLSLTSGHHADDDGTPLRQHFVLPPPLPGEDERGRACLIGVLCLRPDPASLRPNLLRPVDRESDISAMFLGAGSRAPRLEGDDEIIAHHRRAHYPGAFHPASAAPQLIPL